MLTILITGICGLLGTNFSRYLVNHESDVKIIGIDNLSGGFFDSLDHKIIFHECDLLDFDKVEEIFMSNQIDIIYHFAAYAAEGLSPFMRVFNYKTNLLTTTHLINMAIKYHLKRFIFTSSMAVYGEGQVPFDEEATPLPIDPYGISKYACEMDLRVAGEQHGLDWCIIRPHNVYGKYQNIWDIYRNVVGIWMYKLLNNETITIYSDGSQKRAFSYIDDIMEPLWNAGIGERASKQIINLGGIKEITLKNLANELIKIVGHGEIEYCESRHEVKYAYSTYEKSVDLLDFEHKTELGVGLKKMWEWAKIQPNRSRKKWDKYEITDGLYSYWKINLL